MNRNKFVTRWVAATCVVMTFSLSRISAQRPDIQPPDILMVAVDDLRPMLGCYGDSRVRTPHIDRLASRGVLFQRAYCQYAKCGTSRLSLMTGLRPDAVGVFSNNRRDVTAFRKRRPEVISLARCLTDAGYHTQSFGKIYHDGWDLASDWSVPSSPGREREMWEVTDATDPRSPTRIADRYVCPVMQRPDVPDDHLFAGRMTTEVIKRMQLRNGDQPHFWAVGYRRPHLPFVAPRRYYDLYEPTKRWLSGNPLPSPESPVMAWFNSDGYVGSAKRVGLKMPTRPTRSEAIAWNGYELRSYLGVPNHGPIDEAVQLDLLHAYAACVSFVDAQIGRLLDQLDRSGRAERTVVILWSDHGWHLGEQSAWGKMTNFELATRVPLIVAVPGVNPGRTDAISELVDLFPTVCDLAGADAPSHLQGESLLPVLHHPGRTGDRIALSQFARFQEKYMGRAIRTDRYRYVMWIEEASGRVVDRELYDHAGDPNETRNVAALEHYQTDRQQLEQQLRESFAQAP